MPHSFGYRARTRYMFQRSFKDHGMINLSTYMAPYKNGDYVDVKVNPAIHKGMPFKNYHGRTGIVYNISKRSVGVVLNKPVNGKILQKRINVRVEHVRASKCRDQHIERVKKNEMIKQAVRQGKMEKQNLKRMPIMPKAGYTVKLAAPETIQPVPFAELL